MKRYDKASLSAGAIRRDLGKDFGELEAIDKIKDRLQMYFSSDEHSKVLDLILVKKANYSTFKQALPRATEAEYEFAKALIENELIPALKNDSARKDGLSASSRTGGRRMDSFKSINEETQANNKEELRKRIADIKAGKPSSYDELNGTTIEQLEARLTKG